MDGSGGVKRRAELRADLAAVEGSRRWLKILVIVGVIVGAIAALVWYRKTHAPPPPAKYVFAELSTGDVTETVQSTGQVKPVTEVQVGAQVSGRVTNVFVDFNDTVKKDQVLAEIDPSLLSAQIDSGNAQLAAASASVTRAQANLASAKLKLDRAKKAAEDKLASQADVEAAQGLYDVASAEVTAAKADVAQIGAQVKQTRTNLGYTKIFSPIDGVVITRSIDPGQTVAASFQAPVLFVLAQNLTKMRVFADIDEADVGRLHDKMTADIAVDAFPGASFSGHVVQVRLSPTTTQGVVTYAAVIDVDNPELKLMPGMTATVTIHTAEAKGVTRIPNAALRFKPSPPTDDAGKPITQDPLPKLEPGKGRVYVVTDSTLGNEKIEPRVVDIGISDGTYTVLKTDLSGEKIVRDETDAAATAKKKRGFF
jgi:HlyD family secretion protein